MPTLGTLLKTARENASLTQKAVATRFGISRVSVSQWESDDTRPDVDKLSDLAALYGVDATSLLAAYNTDDIPALDELPRTKGQPIHFVPGEQVIIPGREQLLPVYAGAAGGDGKLIIGSEIVDAVEMPADLRTVKGAYGIMVDGVSMEPEFWSGDIAYINPILRPMRGQPHIFYHTPPLGEEAEGIIKRLNGWNDREWDLQQWNPAKSFKESRKIWPIAHRVVGKKYAV
jgi:transcriptional regulator with XRE-family HTH domain